MLAGRSRMIYRWDFSEDKRTGLWRISWRSVDALLNGLFYLRTTVAVSWASYELVAGRKVINDSLAQRTGWCRDSKRGLNKGKAQGEEGRRREMHG